MLELILFVPRRHLKQRLLLHSLQLAKVRNILAIAVVCILFINFFNPPASGLDETKTNVPPAFLVSLKDAEMIENTSFRFMIKILGDPKPRVKL